MNIRPPLHFKIAATPAEFELIHQLNYETFVEEIPQHQPTSSRRLVDKFHAENTYLIALRGPALAGMLAVRGRRPFSLDQKLPALDSYLPSGRSICEIRLLAVAKQFRSGPVFHGLLKLFWDYAQLQGYDLAIISGTTRQTKLYRHLGFTPFGPLLGTPTAQFQPMLVTRESFAPKATEFFRSPDTSAPHAAAPANFLPGPVAVHPEVSQAFAHGPVSHRSPTFATDMLATKKLLLELVGASRMELLLGSGTLANDAIAAQLSLEDKPGWIVTNGEFGERLIEQARRFCLPFDAIRYDWGQAFDFIALRKRLDQSPPPAWLWCAHGETSAGVLNDLTQLKALCAPHHIKLCLDGISSIGTVPVNLEGVHFASAVSGKGLGSYPGVALVFYHHPLNPAPDKLPRYLDLGLYASHNSIPFTHSSNLLLALQTAVRRVDWPRRWTELTRQSHALRARLRELGFQVLAREADAAPAVITLVLPPRISSTRLGDRLLQAGFLLSYNSEYLRQRNWIQICLMGEFQAADVDRLTELLPQLC